MAGIKIGDVDIAREVIDLHYQQRRLLLILQEILRLNPVLNQPSQARMEEINNEALNFVSKKFPNMGITKKDTSE